MKQYTEHAQRSFFVADVSVVCSPDYIEITLLKANFPGIIVNDSVLHLNDMSCGAGYKNDDMVIFTFRLESCGTTMSSNGDKIYYTNNVYLTADPPTENSDIARYHTEVIPFSCGYDKKATISKISYNPRSTLVISDAGKWEQIRLSSIHYLANNSLQSPHEDQPRSGSVSSSFM